MRTALVALGVSIASLSGAAAQSPPAGLSGQLTEGGLTVRGSGRQVLLTIPATLGTTQAALNYQDLGASIQRLNDRVFIGAATRNAGTATRAGTDWVETLIANTTNIAQFASISTIGGFGVLGAARSSDGGAAVGFDVGVAAFAVGDDTVHDAKTTTAFYSEARRMPGLPHDPGNARGNFVIAQENDVHNMAGPGSAVGSVDPYRMYQDLTAANTLLASGKPGLATIDATLALGLFNNGSAFRKGIVFGATALSGATGSGGTGSAIAMGAGHQIEWYAAGRPETPQAAIRSDIATDGTAAAGTELIAFTSAGIALGSGGRADLTLDTAGHLRVGPATPTLTDCGAGATVAGSDQAGRLRTGAGARRCRLAFVRPYGGTPACVVTSQGASRVFGYSPDPAGIALSGLRGPSAYDYACFAPAGG